jgi:cell division protein FtsB
MLMKFPKFKLNGTNSLNLIGGVVIFYLVIVLAQTVQHNYTLGHQIDALNAQINLLQDQKDQLSYNIQFYKTDSFRDREARSKLGLQLPGENVVIIPHPSVSPLPSTANKAPVAKQSNIQQWFNFLSGRS